MQELKAQKMGTQDKTDDVHETKASALKSDDEFQVGGFITYRLARLQAALNAQAGALLTQHLGITLIQWRLLTLINHLDVPRPTDIQDVLGMDKSQISRGIKSLAMLEMVEQASSAKDQRVTLLLLTDKGHQVLNKMTPIMKQRQAYLTDVFSSEERDLLDSFLDRLLSKAHKLEL